MSKKMLGQLVGLNLVLALAMLLTLGVSAASGAPSAQEAMTYTVKLGDNLWTLAKKYLGSGPAWWAIASSTNVKYEEDTAFALIDNPDLIYPGWKFLIPGVDEQGNISLPHEAHGHDAACASYCARAVLHVGTQNEAGEWAWAALNPDGGKIQNCLVESAAVLGQSCLTSGTCPEILDDPEYPDGRCPMYAEDRFGPNPDEHPVICRLMYGPDTHTH